MQHHRRVSMQERFALWVVAAVVGLSVLSSVVLLFNPADPALQAQGARQVAACDAMPVVTAAQAEGGAP